MNNIPTKKKEAFFLAKEAGAELVSRLSLMTLKPKNIVLLGSELIVSVTELYPDAQIVITDHEGIDLPVAKQSIDLIVANFCLPWVREPQKLLPEWYRVLKPDGVLLFNAFGVKTLEAYQQSWQHAIIPGFSDIHNLGDSLVQTGFLDPVLDSAHYEIRYRDGKKLLQELRACNFISEETLEVTTLTLTFEVIQAHAFAPQLSRTRSDDGVATVSLASLKQSLRGK